MIMELVALIKSQKRYLIVGTSYKLAPLPYDLKKQIGDAENLSE